MNIYYFTEETKRGINIVETRSFLKTAKIGFSDGQFVDFSFWRKINKYK